MKVLVSNAGSSSLKYALMDTGIRQKIASGIVERIGLDDSRHKGKGASGEFDELVEAPDHTSAIQLVLDALVDPGRGSLSDISEVEAVGHRVVHGGIKFSESVRIDAEVKRRIRSFFPIAPMHNPHNLAGIEACEAVLDVPHVAVFDTAFHSSMPPHAYMYPIPYELFEKEAMRRYGFHGTSHLYVSREAIEMMGKGTEGTRVITCHIGNGCSIAAVKDGRSIDTSMGFTPLEGVMMGTRSGSIDPQIPLFLIEKGMDVKEVDQMLNKKSGILGLSGIGSSDFRDLMKAVEEGNERAGLAFDVYCYRIKLYIGAYAAAMGGLDAVVFTAGIGENSPELRRSVCDGLEFLGLSIDRDKNFEGKGDRDISASGAPCSVFVIGTQEDLVIAQETERIVSVG